MGGLPKHMHVWTTGQRCKSLPRSLPSNSPHCTARPSSSASVQAWGAGQKALRNTNPSKFKHLRCWRPPIVGWQLPHTQLFLSLSLICIGGQLFPAARKLASTLLNILYIHTLCVFFDKQHQSKVLRSIASADRRLYMGPHNKLYTHTHYVRFKNIVILVLVKEINTYDPR